MKTYKISDIGTILCRNCGQPELPNKMKQGLCVYCQKCAGCDNKECEKTLDQDSGSYFCNECHDSTLTMVERKQKAREAIC